MSHTNLLLFPYYISAAANYGLHMFSLAGTRALLSTMVDQNELGKPSYLFLTSSTNECKNKKYNIFTLFCVSEYLKSRYANFENPCHFRVYVTQSCLSYIAAPLKNICISNHHLLFIWNRILRAVLTRQCIARDQPRPSQVTMLDSQA